MIKSIRAQKKSLGQMLLEEGAITRDQLEQGLRFQKASGEPLGKVLVRQGWINERDVLRVLEGLMVVTFSLAGEDFGIETLYVREIIRAQQAVPVPKSPAYIDGIINFRDKVIPVVDLRRRFGLEPGEVGMESRIVVFEHPSRSAGLLVDSVRAVTQIGGEQLEPAPASRVGIAGKFLYGLGRMDGKLVTLLDIEKILDSEESILMNPGAAGGAA